MIAAPVYKFPAGGRLRFRRQKGHQQCQRESRASMRSDTRSDSVVCQRDSLSSALGTRCYSCRLGCQFVGRGGQPHLSCPETVPSVLLRELRALVLGQMQKKKKGGGQRSSQWRLAACIPAGDKLKEMCRIHLQDVKPPRGSFRSNSATGPRGK